eukprot:COSAG02_NODE_4300_length_5532_cov_6.802503_4_plen_60_part_00
MGVGDDEETESTNVYEVEYIVDVAGPPGWRFYQIKWKGYPRQSTIRNYPSIILYHLKNY